MKKVNILALLGTTLVIATGVNMISVAAQGSFSSHVNSNGDISFPEGFRNSMVHLGSWVVPEGGASGFHDVYTQLASVEAYRETGLFPDGATLVKELRVSSTDDYTTGAGVSYATEDIKQWFVMIKDSRGRFGSNPVWGDGWGWALFAADDTTQNAATDYENDCLACHVPARDNDWIYTEAYPTLSRRN